MSLPLQAMQVVRAPALGPPGGSPEDSDRLAAVSSEPFGPSLVLGSVPSSEILGRAHLAESQAAMQAGEAKLNELKQQQQQQARLPLRDRFQVRKYLAGPTSRGARQP